VCKLVNRHAGGEHRKAEKVSGTSKLGKTAANQTPNFRGTVKKLDIKRNLTNHRAVPTSRSVGRSVEMGGITNCLLWGSVSTYSWETSAQKKNPVNMNAEKTGVGGKPLELRKLRRNEFYEGRGSKCKKGQKKRN